MDSYLSCVHVFGLVECVMVSNRFSHYSFTQWEFFHAELAKNEYNIVLFGVPSFVIGLFCYPRHSLFSF